MGHTEIIMIVDDEAIARDVMEGLLIREGYQLTFATNGPEALAAIAGEPPDVILLDVMMSGMNGFEVCRRLKAEEQWQHIPIILVTALSSKEDLAQGLEAGADDFLTKPVNELELRARVRSMLRIKRQYDKLEASLRVREDLARMIVHDMRSPLSVILGYSELPLMLENNVSAEYLLGDLEKIRTQARRLNGFLNDMLMLAKIEAGQLILRATAVDLNPLVQQVIDSHQIVAESRNVALATHLPTESYQLTLDPNLFQRVLDNLLSNALKFSAPGSEVAVYLAYNVREPEPHICLKVLDQGPGISSDHKERIFDKFEIVNLKRSGVPQVGLGLAFCKMVVEAHGGRIYVEDNQPQGSVFTVEI